MFTFILMAYAKQLRQKGTPPPPHTHTYIYIYIYQSPKTLFFNIIKTRVRTRTSVCALATCANLKDNLKTLRYARGQRATVVNYGKQDGVQAALHSGRGATKATFTRLRIDHRSYFQVLCGAKSAASRRG